MILVLEVHLHQAVVVAAVAAAVVAAAVVAAGAITAGAVAAAEVVQVEAAVVEAPQQLQDLKKINGFKKDHILLKIMEMVLSLLVGMVKDGSDMVKNEE